MNEQWQDWTACEMYGHHFEEGWCRDCGEREEQLPDLRESAHQSSEGRQAECLGDGPHAM